MRRAGGFRGSEEEEEGSAHCIQAKGNVCEGVCLGDV